jgi:hypothetical protein
MSKRFCFALVCAVSVGLVAGESQARPGGGKGGGRPGGARSGAAARGSNPRGTNNFGGGSKLGNVPNLGGSSNFGSLPNLDKPTVRGGVSAGPLGNVGAVNSLNKLQTANQGSRVGAARNQTSQLQASFASTNEPFSPAWYADHPNAWQSTHPHADAWAAASIGTAAAWLGIAAGYPTYYTGETDSDDDAQDGDDTSSDDSSQLAARGAAEVGSDTQFMPLGVYALGPANQNDATAVVQLSVSQNGILRGSYCDLVSDQGQTVYGAVDKQSQRVAWTVGDNGNVVFQTTLASLTGPSGPVSLLFAGGDTRQWTLARFENKTADSQ